MFDVRCSTFSAAGLLIINSLQRPRAFLFVNPAERAAVDLHVPLGAAPGAAFPPIAGEQHGAVGGGDGAAEFFGVEIGGAVVDLHLRGDWLKLVLRWCSMHVMNINWLQPRGSFALKVSRLTRVVSM